MERNIGGVLPFLCTQVVRVFLPKCSGGVNVDVRTGGFVCTDCTRACRSTYCDILYGQRHLAQCWASSTTADIFLLMQISVNFSSDRVVRRLMCVPRFQAVLSFVSFVLGPSVGLPLCLYLSYLCLGLWVCRLVLSLPSLSASWFICFQVSIPFSVLLCFRYRPKHTHRCTHTLCLFLCLSVWVCALVAVPRSRLCNDWGSVM